MNSSQLFSPTILMFIVVVVLVIGMVSFNLYLKSSNDRVLNKFIQLTETNDLRGNITLATIVETENKILHNLTDHREVANQTRDLIIEVLQNITDNETGNISGLIPN